MDVCHHSGVCCQLCEYSCPRCGRDYIATPDQEGIRAACVAIRASWTEAQLARAEGRDEPMEITVATRVWDLRKRKPENGD